MIDFDKFAEEWPSPFVARRRIEEFTHGAYKQSTMCVLDATKRGIPRRFRINKMVFYRVSDVINWLKGKQKNV